MRINKAGSNQAPLGIDEHCMRRNFGAQLRVRSSCNDAALLDEQRRVLDQPEFAQFRASARTRRTGQRGKLADIDDGNRAAHGYLTPMGIEMPCSRAVCRASS